jgi:hypothetical protein
MIIGTILETSDNETTTQPENSGGMLMFYSMADAVMWAQLQSQETIVSGINQWYACCTVINTTTGVKRWWYNGTEYTG